MNKLTKKSIVAKLRAKYKSVVERQRQATVEYNAVACTNTIDKVDWNGIGQKYKAASLRFHQDMQFFADELKFYITLFGAKIKDEVVK